MIAIRLTLAFDSRITRRRLARVPRVLTQPALQLRHPRLELLNDRLQPVDQLALSFDRLGLRCNRRLQLGDPLLISGDLRVVGGHDRIFATTPLTSCTPPKILSNRPSGQVRHLNTYTLIAAGSLPRGAQWGCPSATGWDNC